MVRWGSGTCSKEPEASLDRRVRAQAWVRAARWDLRRSRQSTRMATERLRRPNGTSSTLSARLAVLMGQTAWAHLAVLEDHGGKLDLKALEDHVGPAPRVRSCPLHPPSNNRFVQR